MKNLTTFIIPSIRRETIGRTLKSVENFPHLVGYDDKHEGAGIIRNRLIEQANTPWVSFLDDDDTVTEDYVQRLEEEINAHPEADVIHFREYFLQNGHLLPSRNTVEWGNIGICFSVKRDLALKFPFQSEPYEDYNFVRRLHENGHTVYFSPYLVYRVRH